MDITPEALAKSIFEHPCVRPISFPLHKSWGALAQSERMVLVERAKLVLADLDPEMHLASAAQQIRQVGENFQRAAREAAEPPK